MTPEERAFKLTEGCMCNHRGHGIEGCNGDLTIGGVTHPPCARFVAFAQAIKEAEREAVEPYLRVVEAGRACVAEFEDPCTSTELTLVEALWALPKEGKDE